MDVRIGTSGWTYQHWRGTFYPDGLTQKRELEYAASKLATIEINGTYYGSQKPESFRKWAREVPDGFIFSLKGPRFATNRRVLAEAGDSVKRFHDTGVLELGDRLGPVLWQFAPTKKFDEADFGKFLELLPRKLEGRALRHVVEVRHDSRLVAAHDRVWARGMTITDPAHVAAAKVLRDEAAGLVREVEQDRARFEHADRRAAIGWRVIDDRRHLVVGRNAQVVRLELRALADVHRHDAVIEAGFLEEQRDFVPIRRRPVMEVDHRLCLPLGGPV